MGHSRASQKKERVGVGRKKEKTGEFLNPSTKKKIEKNRHPGQAYKQAMSQCPENCRSAKEKVTTEMSKGWRNGKWHQER